MACPLTVRRALAHGPRWMHSTPGPLAEHMSPRESAPGSLAPIASRANRLKGLRGSLQGRVVRAVFLERPGGQRRW
jgi:hypothetical protein